MTGAGRVRAAGRVRGAVLGLLVALFGVAAVALAAPASAHAELVSASPADGQRLASAPKEVVLTFSENVAIDTGYLRVLNAAGQRIDAGSPTHPGGDGKKVSVPLKSGLPNAGYLVSWRVVSADSHPIGGAYSFVVGNGTPLDASGSVNGGAANPAVRNTFTVVRFLGFFGLVLLGGAVFLVACWPRGRVRARPRAIVWAGWGLTAWAALLGGLLEGPYGAGTGPSTLFNGTLLRATLHTDYGRMISTRLVLLAVLAVLLARLLEDRPTPPWLEDATALTGLGVLATYAAAGHAATGSQAPLTVFADTAHLAAMAAWLGGLVMIAVALPTVGTALARPLARFSPLAMSCVAVLVLTGTYRSWRDIGSWGALLHTTYGRIVLVKICLLAVLLVLGNASRLFVRRVATAGGPPPSAVDGDGPDGDGPDGAGAYEAEQEREYAAAVGGRRTLVPVGGSGGTGGSAGGGDLPGDLDTPDGGPDRDGPDRDGHDRDRGDRDAGGDGDEPAAGDTLTGGDADPDEDEDGAGPHGTGPYRDEDGDGHGGGDAEDAADGPAVPVGVLRRSVLAELVVAAVVLAFTAVLVSEPPGKTSYVAPTHGSVALANKDVATVTLTPAVAGPNQIELAVVGPNGTPVAVQSADAFARLPGSQYDRLPVTLTRTGTGRYSASGVALPASGKWELNVSIRLSQFDAYTAVVPMTVH